MKILILGGGGFIGGSLAARLKSEGHHIRIVDLKYHEFRPHHRIADQFIIGDLRDPEVVRWNLTPDIDFVFQLAADMGGAGYVFTGEHDAEIMHNSALINLNVAEVASVVLPKMLFYSSSACMYPEYNQLDPNNPNCAENSAYPASPDSEYGWEKLFSERLYLAYRKRYGLNVKIARFHNIFGPYGTYRGGKEKAPAAMLRKAFLSKRDLEVWGDGQQTRSFLYIEDCLDAMLKLVYDQSFYGPVNIGSEEMVTINELAKLAIKISGRTDLQIKYVKGPVGVRGRCSDNKLIENKLDWKPRFNLHQGMQSTASWIGDQMGFTC